MPVPPRDDGPTAAVRPEPAPTGPDREATGAPGIAGRSHRPVPVPSQRAPRPVTGPDPELLAALVDRASDAIVAADDDQRITVFNRAAVELFGWTGEEVLGRPLTVLLPEPVRAAHLEHLARFAAEEGTWRQVAQDRGRVLACRRDGSTFPAEISVSKVEIAGGRHFCAVVRDVTAQQTLESTLTRMSLFDPLTGAANRTQLDQRLTQLIGQIEPGHAVSVVFVDVDGFKRINDALGHLHGDEVLHEVTRRLRQACRTQDLVARFGGDEFVVAGPTGDDAESALTLAVRLHRSFAEPFQVAGRTMGVSASLGVAIVRSPQTPAGIALRDADIAVHRAKSDGRDRVVLFDPTADSWAANRLELEGGLHQALFDGDVFIAHQPVIELATGRITGVEALARWRQGGRDVPPCEFIAVAEETGLIIPLGQHVLRQACRDAMAFTRAAGRPIGVAVNLSLRQLADPHLLDIVRDGLQDSGLPAGQLTLEITESTLLQDERGAVPVLDAIREAGVHLSLDDFGTGYSSLRHLKRIPVTQLKVDRSFMADITLPGSGDRTIVSGVILMAHALGLTVTAEGIETREQHDAIRALGADHGQGFYYSPPRSTEAVLDWLGRLPDLPA